MAVTTAPPITTYLEPELIENLQNRLNRIEGHVRGINRMLEQQDDCTILWFSCRQSRPL